jgi:hypothetical protein
MGMAAMDGDNQSVTNAIRQMGTAMTASAMLQWWVGSTTLMGDALRSALQSAARFFSMLSTGDRDETIRRAVRYAVGLPVRFDRLVRGLVRHLLNKGKQLRDREKLDFKVANGID